MTFQQTVPALIASTLLMGCGGSSSPRTFPVSLDPSIEVVQTEDTLTILADGTEISVPLSENGITEGFVGGRVFGENSYSAARFQSDVATATIGSAIEDDTFTVLTSFERLEAFDALPVGQATATGTVTSVFTPTLVDDPATPFDDTELPFAEVSETIVLNVDFDNSTIDGQITSVGADILGNGLLSTLVQEVRTIDLLETPIQRDGGFNGVARYTLDTGIDDGTFGGLIAGEGGSTFVGSFELPVRTGVFQATTD